MRSSAFTPPRAAGVLPFKLGDAERQLRQIGRPRARQLYRWLLSSDLQIKDYNSSKPSARRVIELLILKLSKQASPDAPGSTTPRSGPPPLAAGRR
jgi:hypothetical protein